MIRIVWLFWPVYFTLCVCDGFDETFRAERCFRDGRFLQYLTCSRPCLRALVRITVHIVLFQFIQMTFHVV